MIAFHIFISDTYNGSWTYTVGNRAIPRRRLQQEKAEHGFLRPREERGFPVHFRDQDEGTRQSRGQPP